MASNTRNLNLLKKDPDTDGNDTFNVRTMLNENWDKIDEFAGKTTPISKGGTGATTAAQALANLGGIAVGAVGNLHVWEMVQSGVTDYLTSTDPDAYPKKSAEGGQDAYYTLGAAGYLNFYYSEYDGTVTWEYSSSISVDDDGTVSLVSPSSTSMMADNTGVSAANNLKGKFVLLSAASDYTDATHGVIYYIPADATISAQVSSTTPWYIQTNKAQPVTGYPAIPANTTITYLGQLGEPGAKIEVGSYVGTGTTTGVTLTFESEPKIVIVKITTYSYTLICIYEHTYGFTSQGTSSGVQVTTTWGNKSLTFKNSLNSSTAFNDSGEIYEYIAIG